MKLKFCIIFILSILPVRFGLSINEFNNGYNITDLASDIELIKNSLYKYKEKVHIQLELYYNQTMEKFSSNQEGQTEREKENYYKASSILKDCIKKANNSLFHIPLEDIDYIITNVGANFSIDQQSFSKDCEFWTKVLSNRISMNDCYQLKSPLFRMIYENFNKIVTDLKILVLKNSKKIVNEVKNCVTVAKNWF